MNRYNKALPGQVKEIHFEPGCYLVGDAGSLYCLITHVNESDMIIHVNPDRKFCIKMLGIISSPMLLGGDIYDGGGILSRSLKKEVVWSGFNKGTPELVFKNRIMQKNTNSPHYTNSLMTPCSFKKYIWEGYKSGVISVAKLREMIMQKIRECRDNKTSTRVLFRSTYYYQQLLSLSFSPEFLTARSTRERFINVYIESDDKRVKQIIDEELQCLINGEIPIFHQIPGDQNIYTIDRPLDKLIKQSGYDLAIRDLPTKATKMLHSKCLII